MDLKPVTAYRDGTQLAEVSQANAGMLRRDLAKLERTGTGLDALSTSDLLEICAKAADLFLNADLPFDEAGTTQSADEYVRLLSSTSGLPHAMCRRNMAKIATVLSGMKGILSGLMRGLDLSVIDHGRIELDGFPVSYSRAARSLGVVLPSNSPGVNSIWVPAIALKTPVVLKPGREEPWTPLRIIRALIAAGCPADAFGFYPTDHEGAATILERCDRSQLFGDQTVTQQYASNPAVEIHGPGRSKVFIGEDEIDNWKEHLDVLIASVVDNGGRSCINASAIYVPRHGEAIAKALAEAVAGIRPGAADDPDAKLSAFANPKFAEYIDHAITSGVDAGGAVDCTAELRQGSRLVVEDGGATFLLPTIVHCQSLDHPLANTEFLFPFTSVVEVPQADLPAAAGPSLVVSAITRDPEFRDRLLASPLVERLNVGPLRTSHVEWDQPHEGNLFEFLFTRRAIQSSPGW